MLVQNSKLRPAPNRLAGCLNHSGLCFQCKIAALEFGFIFAQQQDGTDSGTIDGDFQYFMVMASVFSKIQASALYVACQVDNTQFILQM